MRAIGSFLFNSTSPNWRRGQQSAGNADSLPRIELLRTARLGFFGGLLFRARTSQDGLQRTIVFVTGELVDSFLPLLEANHSRPWSDPRGRVVDRDFVVDFVRGDAREAFQQVEVFRSSHEVSLGREVC